MNEEGDARQGAEPHGLRAPALDGQPDRGRNGQQLDQGERVPVVERGAQARDQAARD